MKPISKRISQNFQFAKVLSIYMVVFGHYYDGLELFWVPVTVGLLVFAYSSGYFTAAKYRDNFDIVSFWGSKLFRIVIPLLFADLFLMVIFLFQGKTNILTWQTVISALGLTGFLNWFHIPNNTPFGAGLWFLTLLYIFYALYSLINRIPEQGILLSVLFCLCYTLMMWWCSINVVMGHALWMTSCGFVYGVMFNRHPCKWNKYMLLFFLCLIFCMMVVINFVFSIKIFNPILIIFFSVFLMLFLERIEIPFWLIKSIAWLNGTIFLIYILHPYLFLNIFRSNFKNTVISILFVTFVCKILEYLLTNIMAVLRVSR